MAVGRCQGGDEHGDDGAGVDGLGPRRSSGKGLGRGGKSQLEKEVGEEK